MRCALGSFLFGFVISIQTFAATEQQRPPNPQPIPPRSSKACCHENADPFTKEIDQRLVGVWEVETDWTCGGTEVSHLKSFADKRRWTLNSDGTCHDGAGNQCTWRAENGRILVEFQNLDLHFQGTYKDDQRFTGNMFDDKCEKGCLTGIKISEPPTTPPSRPPRTDKYGLSTSPSIDMGLVDRPVYIHSVNCPADRALMMSPDGTCMVSGGTYNSCRWSARNGRIEINIGNHRFTGRYNGLGEVNGAMENTKQCGNGCLAPPEFGGLPPQPVAPTQPGTDSRVLPLPGTSPLPPVIYSPFIPGGGCGPQCASPN